MKTMTSYYNEAFEKDSVAREPYEPLIEVFDRMGPGMLAERRARANEKLRKLGATFPLPGEEGGKDRVLPADWVPRLIPRDHWERLSAGLLQRSRAINAWLDDLYNGDQGVVPKEIVESSILYRPNPLPGPSIPVHVYGPDVVHMGDGEYLVIEDNVRVPSGIAYSEAVRQAGLAVMKEMFDPYRVEDINDYYEMLRGTFEAAAPPGVEDPEIAMITSGPGDSAFFEHDRIARECSIRLLTLNDLRISNGEVLSRSDGRRIDVIYHRVEAGFVVADLPGLEEVYWDGGIGLANALGVGIADDKAVFPYVPAMISHYLDEKPILDNAAAVSLWEPESREEALERLPELVIKPREGFGAKGVVIGPEASREEIDQARRDIRKDPTGYVAQECLDFSKHVLGDREGEAFIDLRAFVLPAAGYVMPGGLTRVAPPGTRVVNSSAGGSFKDTWVLEG